MKKTIAFLAFTLLIGLQTVEAQGYSFSSNMTLGSRGQEVVNIQSLLISKGYDIPAISSGAAQKGYFGQQTREALARYQQANGIPGTGFFGPLTRSKINPDANAGGGSVGGGAGTGDTGSGNVNIRPVTVLAPNGGEVLQLGTSYNVMWRTTAVSSAPSVSIYVVTNHCPTGSQVCPAVMDSDFTIASNIQNSGSYTWNVGSFVSVQYGDRITEGRYYLIVCKGTEQPRSGGCDSSDQTFSISAAGGGASPLTLISPNGGETWQQGTLQRITWSSPVYFRPAYADLKLAPYYPPCTGQVCPMYPIQSPYDIARGVSINSNNYTWQVGSVMSGYASRVPDGSYLVQICETGSSSCDSSNAPFTISGSSVPPVPGPAPVIHGLDAPTTLAVGQTGTWTVRASDPQGGALSYSVVWGDEPAYYMAQSTASASGQFVQATTFTHAYATTGNYSPIFTVKNSAGSTRETRASVQVGLQQNLSGVTLVSPNGGEIWRRGTQQNITWSGFVPGYNVSNGSVRITMAFRCPPTNGFCTAQAHPTYIVQNSATNSGSSAWQVGSVTIDGYTAASAPNGTYLMTVCRYDGGAQTTCDTSDALFTITD